LTIKALLVREYYVIGELGSWSERFRVGEGGWARTPAGEREDIQRLAQGLREMF
jgi:hypothetical protein